jgi:capsular exopolysaccharide synthesis family protein
MEEQSQSRKSEIANLSLKDLFFKYVRFLPLFIISVALSLLVAYVYLRYATLIYQSSGSLVVTSDKQQTSNDRFEQLMISDGNRNIQNEIELLKSRPLMERVVRNQALNFSYYAIGKIKELNIYKSSPFLVEALSLKDTVSNFEMKIAFASDGSFSINQENQRFRFGQVFSNPYGVFRLVRNKGEIGSEYRVLWQNTSSVASGFSGALIVIPKANTGILNITLQSTNPDLAADVINGLMREYQIQTVEDKNNATRQTIDFIEARLDVVSRELDSVTNRILAYRMQNNLIDVETQSSNYFSRIEAGDRERNEHRVRLNNANMIQDYLEDKRYTYTIVPTTLGLDDPTLTTLISAYNVAQLERQELIKGNTPPGNVMVRQKDEQIEKLRQNILENVRNIKSSINAALGSLARQSSEVESQIRALPSKQQMLVEMERQQESKLVLYKSLLEKREESAIALASTISNIKVLQNAAPGYAPVQPNRRNARMLAIVIGLALPALFIFVLEILNDKVTTRYDIEKLTDTTILGEVGHSFSKENLVIGNNNRSVVAEQFRIIRSNLQYILTHASKPVVLVTSSFSGEGKSFISTNMGAVMALAGKKTIILEFDIRKPKILSHLGLPKKPGLTNYLLGKVKLEDLPIAIPGHDNLYVLPCGPVPPNPAELLLDPRLNELFAYLKANFDMVVMDTAPVGMVGDAQTLSQFADCTLYIVRQGYTYKKQIGIIDEFHRQGKLPRISIVMNDVKTRSGYGYYGYGGRYGYGYGSGYFDDEPQPNGMLNRWMGWFDTKKWKKKRKKAKI